MIKKKKKKTTSPESGHRRRLPQLNKDHICEKNTANIILSGEKLKTVL